MTLLHWWDTELAHSVRSDRMVETIGRRGSTIGVHGLQYPFQLITIYSCLRCIFLISFDVIAVLVCGFIMCVLNFPIFSFCNFPFLKSYANGIHKKVTSIVAFPCKWQKEESLCILSDYWWRSAFCDSSQLVNLQECLVSRDFLALVYVEGIETLLHYVHVYMRSLIRPQFTSCSLHLLW